MTHTVPARQRVVLLLALAAAVLGLLGLAPLASAAPAPTATQITVTSISTPSITVPNTPGAGAPYVVRGTPFDVAVATDAPLSATKSTRLLLTVTSGPDAGRVTAAVDVPAGATTATVSGVVLPSAANGVGLQVAVDARKTDVLPGRASTDVLRLSLRADRTSTLTGFGGGGGPGVPCSPTVTDAVCGDLLLPETNGVLSDELVSQGACDGLCNAAGSFLQALVAVDPAVYNTQNPIEVVAKCDKSLCGGKGVKTYSVSVQLAPGSPAVTAPACAAKGVIDTGKFCVDYVSSTRDNAGDLLLSVLLAEDAKIIFN